MSGLENECVPSGLVAKILKSRFWQGHAPSETLGKDSSLTLSASGCPGHFLACGSLSPLPASTFTWYSPCVTVLTRLSFHNDTSHTGLGVYLLQDELVLTNYIFNKLFPNKVTLKVPEPKASTYLSRDTVQPITSDHLFSSSAFSHFPQPTLAYLSSSKLKVFWDSTVEHRRPSYPLPPEITRYFARPILLVLGLAALVIQITIIYKSCLHSCLIIMQWNNNYAYH